MRSTTPPLTRLAVMQLKACCGCTDRVIRPILKNPVIRSKSSTCFWAGLGWDGGKDGGKQEVSTHLDFPQAAELEHKLEEKSEDTSAIFKCVREFVDGEGPCEIVRIETEVSQADRSTDRVSACLMSRVVRLDPVVAVHVLELLG
jgi:hypothetical protein